MLQPMCKKNTCSKAKPRYGDESSEHTVTSDDSASIDAAPMRLFVASPPERDRSASGAVLMEDHLGYGMSRSMFYKRQSIRNGKFGKGKEAVGCWQDTLRHSQNTIVEFLTFSFRRKQSGGDGDSDFLCEKLKVGAFASRASLGPAGEGDTALAAESTDQLLQLFSRRREPDDNVEKEGVKEVK